MMACCGDKNRMNQRFMEANSMNTMNWVVTSVPATTEIYMNMNV
jgi:hypothetical protein